MTTFATYLTQTERDRLDADSARLQDELGEARDDLTLLRRELDGLRNDHRSALRANLELTAANARLRQQLAAEETQHSTTVDDRDHYQDMADRLADAIATLTGVDIGEHSSMNDPWQNALDAAQSRRPAAPVPVAPAQEIRPADWEQQAIDAATEALRAGWPLIANDPVAARRLATDAVRAIIDAGLAGAGGRCRQCNATFPRTLPAGQDPLCWTCETEQQDGPFEKALPGISR